MVIIDEVPQNPSLARDPKTIIKAEVLTEMAKDLTRNKHGGVEETDKRV